MVKNWRKIAAGLCCGGAAMALLFAALHFMFSFGGRSYELRLPNGVALRGVSLMARDGTAVEIDGDGAEDIFSLFRAGRTTREESIQDTPVNAKEWIQADLHFASGEDITLFVYPRGSGWAIEQPYNGIYKMSENEYALLESYVEIGT